MAPRYETSLTLSLLCLLYIDSSTAMIAYRTSIDSSRSVTPMVDKVRSYLAAAGERIVNVRTGAWYLASRYPDRVIAGAPAAALCAGSRFLAR